MDVEDQANTSHLSGDALRILRKSGWKEDINIAEFWLQNRDSVSPKMNRIDSSMCQTFDLQARWLSAEGIVCRNAVFAHIEMVRDAAHEDRNMIFQSQGQSGLIQSYQLPAPIVNFAEVQYEFDGQSKSLTTFTENYPTRSHVGGLYDLRGINLDGIRINDIQIQNAFFAESSFRKSSISQSWVNNCNFVKADFSEARLVMVRFDDACSFSGTKVSGAFLNALTFTDENLSSPFEIREVGYFEALKTYWRFLLEGDTAKHQFPKATTFLCVDIAGTTKPEMAEQCEYVNWQQSLLKNLRSLKTSSMGNRIGLASSVISTKYWSSYWALLCISGVINAIFATIYTAFNDSFNELPGDWFSAYYYSVVTFTTLGYGEIHPLDWWGKLLVIIEVVLGYIVLGCLVFLIAEKYRANTDVLPTFERRRFILSRSWSTKRRINSSSHGPIGQIQRTEPRTRRVAGLVVSAEGRDAAAHHCR